MEVIKEGNDVAIVLKVKGRVDSVTSEILKKSIDELPAQMRDLTLDLTEMPYISSAGLRVLLIVHKSMAGKGTFTITGVSPDVMDVFEITGFKDILNIV